MLYSFPRLPWSCGSLRS